MSRMRKIVAPALVMILSATTGIAFDRSSDAISAAPAQRALLLARWVRRTESASTLPAPPKGKPAPGLGRLSWEESTCRAKQLVSGSYFGHRDPATGKNPGWDMVGNCFEFRVAGENLVKGRESPQFLHMTLMRSPSHRENIMDPGYDLVGVGCWDQVCVELFAGF